MGYAGWVENVVDSSRGGSRFAKRDSVRIELRRNVQIESNRKVPQTNRLSFGVLDMVETTDVTKTTQWSGNETYRQDFELDHIP